MPSEPPTLFRSLLSHWAWTMAWRDSRRSRARLLMFSSSIILGVAAMAAVGSFGKNLSDAVEDQSKALLGADLEVSTRIPFTEEQRQLLDSLGDDRSTQISFSSMLRFPLAEAARLVQVRTLSGKFPYYGAVETSPASGAAAFRKGEGVLVEENLLLQYGAKVGDPVRLGDLETRIVGALQNVPGETMMLATVAPRVFLPDNLLASSGLMGTKSIARYCYYFQFNNPEDQIQAKAAISKVRDEYRWRVDDVEERKQDLGNLLRNLYRFLNLASFVALLLGAIGIASAIQLHIRQKLTSVAVLRCLGAASDQAFAIYLIQAFCLGLLGVVAGTVCGLLVQQYLPLAFADFLPLKMDYHLYVWPLIRAACVGLGICLLFALHPLLPIRTVSPLRVLRASHEPRQDHQAELVIYGIIAATVALFAVSQSDRWHHGMAFTVGLGAVLALLYGVAQAIAFATRKAIHYSWPYVMRQGLASLYRPNNRTSLLMLSLGLGTFLILTLHLSQHGLVRELFPEAKENRANAIFFDVQSDQVDAIRRILANQDLPVLDESPIVSMRITSIKGRSVTELRRDRQLNIPGWALRREYRSTFRDSLSDSETLAAGKWVPKASFDDPVIPISLDASLARDLQVTLGDQIKFDVQGIPLMTEIASLRDVDWRRLQANFFVVFPMGVLDNAPGFHIITTRVPDAAASAQMQREVTEMFPNVSTIDLMLVLEIINSIVGKISFGIQFMALFTAFTGVVLLITATLNSRYQRIQESIQLRTLGASKTQILKIQFVEYCLLGVMASLTGILLAIVAAWAIATFVFEVAFSFPLWQVVVALITNCLITISVGVLSSWGITRHSPLALLRQEG
ncbi:MAG: Macrolide export ATP-binding/permease protein MacB [Verrucomicrobia subdivision 3 bacterium]|nr:Macrolide export ATP-binding/permease protein MacB [Limisphaerales bacterium]MCS1415471.1 Macrolide export ATP-binding/permease protein MacB [Limisphaerales bacterium]